MYFYLQITTSDPHEFLIEFSGFLKEVQGSYEIFTNDSNNRMQSVESRYLLLEFLIAELMSQKMFLVTQKPKEKGNVITVHESTTAAALKDIAITLNLGKPPENIAIDALFGKINSRYEETLQSVPDGHKRVGNSLFVPKNTLKDEQWMQIEKIQATLDQEYNLRRKMLITRLDVTVQSFKWSENIRGKEKEINEKFGYKSQLLDKMVKGEHRTDIVALLAARDKLAIIEKTSSANVSKNTKSKLQRYIIGKVPDRGGRALDRQRPPPEMPSWQKRQPGGNDRGGGGKNFNQNPRGGQHQQNQGYPAQQYQQKGSYNPSNQYDNNQQQSQSFNENNRGGSRVQGGWNQRGNQSYGDDNNQQGFRGRGRGNYRR